MAKYVVNFGQVKWIRVAVEADDEESAIDAAYDGLPEPSAQETGWGQDHWSADLDEAMLADDFYGIWTGNRNRFPGDVVELVDE